jgi:nitrogen fixation-related uncharacterized protein
MMTKVLVTILVGLAVFIVAVVLFAMFVVGSIG